MESIVISHRSSIELLDTVPHLDPRHKHAPQNAATGRSEPLLDADVPVRGTNSWERLRALVASGALPVSLPIDMLAPHDAGHHRNRLVVPHGCRRLPQQAEAIPLPQLGIHVVSPELAFIQLCARMSPIEAAELGMQLAGTYRRLRPKEAASYAAIPRASLDLFPRGSTPATCTRATAYNMRPLTSAGRLTAFVSGSPGIYGARAARQALPLIRGGLRSPLEAELFMRCFLPRKWGGLGVREPLINRPLALTGQAARLAGKRTIIPDFSWPGGGAGDVGLVVEALGKRDHDGEDGITDTSRREKAYRAMDVTCLTITAAEMRDQSALISFASEVCRELGLPFPKLTDATRKRTRHLNETLVRMFDVPGSVSARVGNGAVKGQAAGTGFDEGWFEALSREIDTYGPG